MRQEIVLSLNKMTDRPITELEDFFGISVLVDTGARFPVWTGDEETLAAIGGIKYKQNIDYSGVGGNTQGDLYRLPSFKLGSETNGLVYPGLPVVTNKEFEDAPFQMILSATMFHNLEYTINDKLHTMTIKIPDDKSNIRNAVIKQPDESIQVLFVNEE